MCITLRVFSSCARNLLGKSRHDSTEIHRTIAKADTSSAEATPCVVSGAEHAKHLRAAVAAKRAASARGGWLRKKEDEGRDKRGGKRRREKRKQGEGGERRKDGGGREEKGSGAAPLSFA
eukprot:3941391-Rhodomonas_salina.3